MVSHKSVIAAVVMGTMLLASVVLAGPAYAELVKVEESTETVGATTITFDSSFEDLDYTVGDTITMTVTWTVDEGAAEYEDFVLRGPEFTPKGPDPADGELISAENTDTESGGEVEVVFRFTELHYDEERDVDLGNAHFSLVLDVDEDGDGNLDTLANFGVNVHVEDPNPTDSQSLNNNNDNDDGNGAPPAGKGPPFGRG